MRAVPLLLCLVGSIVVAQRRPAPVTRGVPPVPAAERPAGWSGSVFVENRGQWSPEARWVARSAGVTVRLERAAVSLDLRNPDPVGPDAVVRLALGGDRAPRLEPDAPLPGVVHHLVGDRDRWRRRARTCASVHYRSVRPGVDVRFRGAATGGIEYDVTVAAGARVSALSVRCEGVETLESRTDGALVLHTPAGPLVMTAPVAWQTLADGRRVDVPVRFTIDGCTFGFAAPTRDPSRALTIDPRFVFGTYAGGAALDRFDEVLPLAGGDVIVIGTTASAAFPTTPGAYSRTLRNEDVVVARFARDGRTLRWATLLGGSLNDHGLGGAVDTQGRVTVVGQTDSADFPVTAGVVQSTLRFQDAYVTRLDPTGSSLVFSTYLGGSGSEHLVDAVVDPNGETLVVGTSWSPDFPVRNAAQANHSGGGDAVVARLAADASALVFSTYCGGPFTERGYAIATDPSGAVTFGGETWSTNFPTTAGAFDRTYGGLTDAYVVQLTRTGGVVFSTFLGGTADDCTCDLVVGPFGDIYAVGTTWSPGFPTTPGAYQTSLRGSHDAFVARIAPGGGSLVYGTFVGGSAFFPSAYEGAHAVAIDPLGVVTVAGITPSTDFPVTAGALAPRYAGGMQDAFVVRLDAAGATLLHATYFGGSGDETPRAIAADATGEVVIVGDTTSTDLPTTTGAIGRTLAGGDDGFVARIALADLRGPSTARPGTTVALAFSAGDANVPYRLVSSLRPGSVPVGWRQVPIGFDGLFAATMASALPSLFVGYAGTADAAGNATASIRVPAMAALVGQAVHTAFVTLAPRAPLGIRAISNAHVVTIVP